MSFTSEVCEELLRLPLKKTCCRKAMLYGLLFHSRRIEGEDALAAYFYHKEIAELAARLLGGVFRETVTPEETVRAGRRAFVIRTQGGALASFLHAVDTQRGEELSDTVGFRCPACAQAFLRGVFLGCGTVSDPHKGYHLELPLPTEGRADALTQYLSAHVIKPSRSARGGRYSLLYKSNGAIFEFLYFIGCAKTGFDVANVSIEREIRNNENRATNCVTRNISRSVEAAQRQMEAIEHLTLSGRIESLPEELRETARLRAENESASLAELALLHQPPLTKSGLNRRLTRLLEEAELI